MRVLTKLALIALLACVVLAALPAADAKTSSALRSKTTEQTQFFDKMIRKIKEFFKGGKDKKEKNEEMAKEADKQEEEEKKTGGSNAGSESGSISGSNSGSESGSETGSESGSSEEGSAEGSSSGEATSSETGNSGEGEASESGSESGDSECPSPRVRYSWRALKADSSKTHLLKNYLKAVQAAYKSGEFMGFAKLHYKAQRYAHGGNNFLPWHREFLWQYEDMLRKACPECGCVTVPYWNWAHDAGTSCDGIFCSEDTCAGELHGEDGIVGGPFEGFEMDGKKVFRKNPSKSLNIHRQAALNKAIEDNPAYGTPRWAGSPQFANKLEGIHGAPHCAVGDCGEMSKGEDMGPTMGSHYSPSDPIFYSHHAFIDYLWAIWQDCWDHDKISNKDLHLHPNAFAMFQSYDYAKFDNVIDNDLDTMIKPWETRSYRDTNNIVEMGMTYKPSATQEFSAFAASSKCKKFAWFPELNQENKEGFLEVTTKAMRAHRHHHAEAVAKEEIDRALYNAVLEETDSPILAETALVKFACSQEDTPGRLPEPWLRMNGFSCVDEPAGCPSACAELGYPSADEGAASLADLE